MRTLPFRDTSGVAKYRHEVLAVVLRVCTGGSPRLEVLAWQRHHEPFEGRWALPSGPVEVDETMDAAMERHLATKLDLTTVRHSEQLASFSAPLRDPAERTIATAYLGLVAEHTEVSGEEVGWFATDRLPAMAFDHGEVVALAARRLQGKISYSNIAFALAPEEFTLAALREIYIGVLRHDVDVTNLSRVLSRRGQIEPTGRLVAPGDKGGRPARSYRFVERRLRITDPFAVLRAGGSPSSQGHRGAPGSH
ncbi:NUDIX hydrolase [Propionibacterium cyclohexanicum]|uniref:NUDIX hydrolase n=1 Tax=Propionibacterium cyclohexanicum TaxID=64702 RepID=UPI000B89C1F1|nr:NUDIX domain-containing protein [Propionibacterium cyclohexanicum]